MSKKLSEMSLEELWQLFPIILTEHRADWKTWYAEEAERLKHIFPAGQTVRISHIGSTAIAGIRAKPIIDILVEAAEDCDFSFFKECLTQAGYLCMSESLRRLSFNKGYTENGFAERVFHLHLRRAGDHDELYFRDYLNANPKVAREYEALKLGLRKQYEHDRDGYTGAKSAFILKYTGIAKAAYEVSRLRQHSAPLPSTEKEPGTEGGTEQHRAAHSRHSEAGQNKGRLPNRQALPLCLP